MQSVLTTEGKKAAPVLTRKQTFGRRMRGTLLLSLAAFVLFQAGLRLIIDEWQPELRDPPFEIKYRQLTGLVNQHRQPPATVVFLGSSMTAHGIRPALMGPPLEVALGRPVVGYNLGINGAGPIAQLIYAQRLLRRGIRPDLLVLEASPMHYGVGQAEQEMRRFPAHVLEKPDLDILQRYGDLPERRGEWLQSRLVPAYGHRLMILNRSARCWSRSATASRCVRTATIMAGVAARRRRPRNASISRSRSQLISS